MTSDAGFGQLGLAVRPALPVVVDHDRASLWPVARSCRNRATHTVTSTHIRFEPGFRDPAARPSWPWFSRRADAKRLRPLAKIRIPESAPALRPISSSVCCVRSANSIRSCTRPSTRFAISTAAATEFRSCAQARETRFSASTSANVRCCGSSSLIALSFSRKASEIVLLFGLPPGFGDGPPFFQRVDAPMFGSNALAMTWLCAVRNAESRVKRSQEGKRPS